jgi:hypothetical protein
MMVRVHNNVQRIELQSKSNDGGWKTHKEPRNSFSFP